MRTILPAALLALAFCLGASAAAPPEPVTWKVEGAPTAPVKPGATFTIRLVATIQETWHVYSLKPIEDGPIPTHVWIAPGQPFQLAAAVKGDEPETMMDPTLKTEVELYSGQAGFDLSVKTAADAKPGKQNLVVSATYQSCNDQMCLPPKTVKVEVSVTVAK